jgi:hypothetical protein
LSSREEKVIKKRQSISTVLFLALALGLGWAQGNSGQPAGSDPQSRTEPAPAIGPGTVSVGSDENPPISGLDQPSLEPKAAVRSFLVPGASVSEAVDSNVSGSNGNAVINGVTRALGSLTLQRLWSRYDLALDYVGGIAYYSNRAINAAQIQAFDLDQRVQWRTGQLAVRDSFSYLPEGQFGYGAFGGAGALSGIGGGAGMAGNLGIFFGPGLGATLGQDPRITNRTIVDVTQGLSPRSSVTAAGSYGLVHFTDNTPTLVNGVLVSGGFIDSRQVSAQAGYNYQVTRKDQLALVYGYQRFTYPNSPGRSFDTNLINLLYGHRITGRMDFVIGGGPQWTNISSVDPVTNKPVTSNQVNLSGRALLRYRFPRTNVGLYYDHYNTSGSGFFAGAKSDVARLSATHPLGRLWTSTVDVGYTHNDRLAIALGPIPLSASSYGYIYAGGSVRRQFGREFSAFLSYQFNYLNFDSSFCTNGTPCNRTGQRHVAIVGVDWHPHPIRLD